MPPPAMDTMALTAAFGAGFSAYAFLTKYFSEDKSDGTVFTEPEKKLLIAKNLSVDEEFNDSVIADDDDSVAATPAVRLPKKDSFKNTPPQSPPKSRRANTTKNSDSLSTPASESIPSTPVIELVSPSASGSSLSTSSVRATDVRQAILDEGIVTRISSGQQSDDNMSCDESDSATRPVSLLAPGFFSDGHLAADRLTGVEAVASVALQLCDGLYMYESGDGLVAAFVEERINAGQTNVFGHIPRATAIATRAGAGNVVVGASDVMNNLAVFVPSQSLPLMIPALLQLRRRRAACVLHTLMQSMDESLSYHSDHSGVYLARGTGVPIVASYTPQEASDMAIVAHVVAKQCRSPIVHAFDGDAVARSSTLVQQPACASSIVGDEGASEGADVAGVFDSVFADMATAFGKRYQLFETPSVTTTARHVIVVFGSGVGQIRAAAAESSTPVTVIHVRVYRPWSPSHFVAALPPLVQRMSRHQKWTLGVVNLSSRPSVADALVADVAATFAGSMWQGPVPSVVKFNVQPSEEGVTMCKARAVVQRVVGATTGATVPIVAGYDAMYEQMCAANNLSDSGPAVCVWGSQAAADNTETASVSVDDVIATIGTLAGSKLGLRHNAVVEADYLHPSAPSHGKLLVEEKVDAGVPSFLPNKFNVTLVTDVSLLESHVGDIAHGLDRNGKSSLFVVTSLPREEVVELIPADLRAVLLVSRTTLGLIHCTTAQDIAAAALSVMYPNVKSADSLCDTSLELIPLPADWSDESPSNAYGRTFTKRLSVWGQNTEDADAADETNNNMADDAAAIVPQHSVSWSYIFNSYVKKTEAHARNESHIYRVKCTKNQRLTPADYHRNVFHMEFDISGSGLTYNIGDALGVFGHNNADDVLEFLDFYGVDGAAFVSVPSGTGGRKLLTVEQLFTTRLDLFGKPSQKFYAALTPFAENVYQRKKLKWLGSEDKEGFKLRQYEAFTYADILMEFTSAHPSVLDLIKMVPEIKPRHYSISSSQKMCPNSVHLLVVAVDWVTPKGRTRYGQCTRYLAGMNPETAAGECWVTVDIKPSVCQLPSDPKQPVICAGLGTGLAPYRAFVQERTYLKQQGVEIGPMSLYFGARFRAKEFLYQEDLEAAANNGVITDLRLAFSRDQNKKEYIQHKILDDKEKLAKYLKEDGGYFYMCGPTWPVPDVRKAIMDGLTSATEFSEEDADNFLEELKEEGRYILEVY